MKKPSGLTSWKNETHIRTRLSKLSAQIISESDCMRLLRLLGSILLIFAFAFGSILFYEEFINNLNYYYNNQVNFVLLLLFGILSFGIGLWLINWKSESEEQNLSRLSHL
jgi:hypothetical protein